MNATYLAFAAAVALLIASPGPVVALVIADARRSWPAWTILGGVLSAQLLMIAALVVIYLALDLQPVILEWGQVIGGLYLIWLGADGLCGGDDEEKDISRPQSHYFWRAMAVGLSNPKDILFFLAFLPGFILPAQPFAPQAVTLIAIWAFVDISILVTYSLVSRRLASHDTLQRALTLLPSFFLLGLGLVSCGMGINSLIK
ncbi:LysE family translocator [Stutzerimonas zhaodongensis]|uniref:LysE family translocator n=1 Tax=Stutzerimonas zhaodongensis TaxID=1176257 RepID=A0A3M2HXB6_9GAMM|nr:LysE family translocator [Stutzerimonas zhaodongensis]MCQ2028188.1 LysE family translocator [Stutzerimonas zhaodongensis]MCQ4315590.1 LysE family translocator [Stutzerimonas zhaodongensis]RMH91542.1 LysE family translocator [Stutzerimonas zhaodongensis]